MLNRAPSDVKTRDMELVLGKWDKRAAKIVLEELEYNVPLFIEIGELTMCGGGQYRIEPHKM